MNDNKFFYKFPLIQTCSVFFVLTSIFLFLFINDCHVKSNKFVSYSQDVYTELSDKLPIYMEFSIPEDKLWRQADRSYGAQYDGKFINNTVHKFTDWKVTIRVPEGYWIDSNWNAIFSFQYTKNRPIPESHSQNEEFQRQFKSKENLVIMEKDPKSSTTEVYGKKHKNYNNFMLGMIMYSENPAKIDDITIEGRFIYSPTEQPLFYVLISLISLLLISIITLVAVQYAVLKKVKYYEIRQKLDSDIIIQAFRTFSNFVDAKDTYTKGHSLRVAHYAKEIAKRLKMSSQEKKEIFWLGLMHDVGKIGIPDEILNKPSKLDEAEYNKIKQHTQKGYEMLLDFTAMPMLKLVAKSHHEHWDGTGYCEQLKGEEIPLEARIVCICDAYDAMNSDRCYRKKLSREEIIKEIQNTSGTIFDPKIAEIFISMIKDNSIDKIDMMELDTQI